MNIKLNIKNDGSTGEIVLDVTTHGIQVALNQQGNVPPRQEPAPLPAKVKRGRGRPKKLRAPEVPLLGVRDGAAHERNGAAGE